MNFVESGGGLLGGSRVTSVGVSSWFIFFKSIYVEILFLNCNYYSFSFFLRFSPFNLGDPPNGEFMEGGEAAVAEVRTYISFFPVPFLN